MKRNGQRMLLVFLALLLATTAGAIWNAQTSKRNLTQLENATIAIAVEGKDEITLTQEQLYGIESEVFSANLKSSLMEASEPHQYEGYSLLAVLHLADVVLQGDETIEISAADGYVTVLEANEIQKDQNAYLVFRDNGELLGTYGEKNATGPYLLVVREDSVSQRWVKYVCRLEVKLPNRADEEAK